MEGQSVDENVLLDLLADAPSCLVEKVVRMYPDLPARSSMTEREIMVRRMSCPELVE